ncbi:hypothetical protein [Calothrix sp. 336/3]|uniref:hypothetical protein n=1 Tax=Calothrix sp. 336/3 TaxID=1337936 RepID=UPI0004E32DAC|nr:hypothetical protein [Calothrix sp. 336/3]AKG22554.1 hypothetical protein IJ00_15880 [Calothrix sp. 336/3]
MQPALRITTKVLPGNKIEIEIPEAEIGDSVDVFVILPEKAEPKRRSVLDIIEVSRTRHSSRTAEDIDKQLQKERASWDS